MSSLTKHEAEQKVRSWGFSTVYTWTDGPNAHYPPHRHSGLTTHLILSGKFTVSFPEDAPSGKETFGPGARIDVPAKKVHEVWMGNEGCTFKYGPGRRSSSIEEMIREFVIPSTPPRT